MNYKWEIVHEHSENSLPAPREVWNGSFFQDDKMYIFGGGRAEKPRGKDFKDLSIVMSTNDLWMYDFKINEWEELMKEDLSDEGRYMYRRPGDKMGNTFLRYKDKAYLFGGLRVLKNSSRFSSSATNDLWEYDIKTNNWTLLEVDDGCRQLNNGLKKPFARSFFGSTVCGGCIYIFGGWPSTRAFGNDLWKYDIKESYWKCLTAVNADQNKPCVRYGSYLAEYNNNLYLFGGRNTVKKEFYNDMWIFDTSKSEWLKLFDNNNSFSYPCARYVPGRTVYGKYLYMYGGYSGEQWELNDLWRFDFETVKWEQIMENRPERDYKKLREEGRPAARRSTLLENDGKYIYVYSGINTFAIFNGNKTSTLFADIWRMKVNKSV